MTKKLAVLGNPIAHSLSPQMHNAWIADHGLDAVYERVLIEGGDAGFAAFMKGADLYGANVTVPFKSAAASHANWATHQVVNTLYWATDDLLVGYNTDGAGFLAALEEGAPGVRAQNVLILGAGGAAEGIADVLTQTGAKLTIANRTFPRGQALADALGARAARWEDLPALFAHADLIVQTTTLGMKGAESPDWPVAACKADAVLMDIVYRPLETPFLKAARARGLKAVDGLGMLIHQGALAFDIWFGIKPDTQKARERLMAVLAEEG